jgi:hypothetical protein
MPDDRSTVSSKSTGPTPPRLRLHLAHHLKMLAMLNIIPLLGGLYLWWQYSQGKITLRKPISEESWITLFVVLIAGALFAVSCWFVLPIARWLRDNPAWHFRHGNRALWALPALGGWLAWLTLSFAGLAVAAICLVEAGRGIWTLFVLAR